MLKNFNISNFKDFVENGEPDFFFNVGDMCVKSGRKSFQSLINAS